MPETDIILVFQSPLLRSSDELAVA
jgi:hypothetical protein